MKKVLAFILALTMVAALFGCGKELPETPQVTTEAHTEPATEPTTVAPTEPAETEPFETEPAETEPPGEPVQVRRIGRIDKLGETFTFIYEDKQSPKVMFLLGTTPYRDCTFYPDGRIMKEENYNAGGELSFIYEYNEQGQLMTQHFLKKHTSDYTLEYIYTPEGLPETVTASAPQLPSMVIKKWVYDDQGRTLEYEDFEDVWLHSLHPYGQEPEGVRELWEYDEKGQVIDYRKYCNDTLFMTRQLSYDAQGNVTTEKQKHYTIDIEQQIDSVYSDKGLLIREYKQQTNQSETVTRLSEYRYDSQDRKVGCTHTMGNGEVFEETWDYDSRGVLREEITYNFLNVVQKMVYHYNKQGLLTDSTVTQYDHNGKVRHTYLHRYDYDKQGNLLKKEYFQDEDRIQRETYEYDNGKLVYLTWEDQYSPPGFQRRHYDDDGNLIDVSTNRQQSLTEGTDTLITTTSRGGEYPLFLALTYAEDTVQYSDAAVWEKIDQYILQHLTERG